MKAYFDTFAKPEDICDFINDSEVKPISVIYRDYNYILFYIK